MPICYKSKSIILIVLRLRLCLLISTSFVMLNKWCMHDIACGHVEMLCNKGHQELLMPGAGLVHASGGIVYSLSPAYT